MASRRLRLTSAAGSVPQWRATKILLSTAIRSSSLLGHDLIHRFRAERYQVFLSGHFALWASAGVVLPLLEYVLAGTDRPMCCCSLRSAPRNVLCWRSGCVWLGSVDIRSRSAGLHHELDQRCAGHGSSTPPSCR